MSENRKKLETVLGFIAEDRDEVKSAALRKRGDVLAVTVEKADGETLTTFIRLDDVHNGAEDAILPAMWAWVDEVVVD